MDIRIAFFDMDGTLLPVGAEGGFSPRLTRALSELQKKGVALFAASGRPPFFIPAPEGVAWDGMICFNGAYCLDGGRVVNAVPIPRETAERVVENAGAMGLPVNIETPARMGRNFFHPDLDAFMGAVSATAANDRFQELLGEEIYQLMAPVRADQEAALFAGTAGIKAERWWDRATDIVPVGCSKADGMRRILEARGLAPENAIAFGDGGNDAEMIALAGVGVAMGNALEAVRRRADYVTCACEEDGVAEALRHFGLTDA